MALKFGAKWVMGEYDGPEIYEKEFITYDELRWLIKALYKNNSFKKFLSIKVNGNEIKDAKGILILVNNALGITGAPKK